MAYFSSVCLLNMNLLERSDVQTHSGPVQTFFYSVSVTGVSISDPRQWRQSSGFLSVKFSKSLIFHLVAIQSE